MKKTRNLLFFSLCLILCIYLSLCSYSVTIIDKVFLDSSSLTIEVGETISLTAYLNNGTVAVDIVDWKSSNENVAEVFGGVIKGKSPGTTKVTVKLYGSNATDSCTIKVKGPESDDTDTTLDDTELDTEFDTEIDTEIDSDTQIISLVPTNDTVYVGNHIYIKANTELSSTIEWKSSDDSIATVAKGIVTAISAGKVTITATVDGVSASCTITVNKAQNSVFNLSSYSKSIYKKQSYRISAKNTSSSITWTSSDENIATVTNGYINGINTGVAIISATDVYGNIRTCAITVNGLAPIKFLYSNPNMAALDQEVELIAITDNTRSKVRFVFEDNGEKVIINADEKPRVEENTFVWSAKYTFSKSGLYNITAESYKNKVWSSGRQGTFDILISNNNDLKTEILEERRVSTDLANIIASFEGFSSTIYDDLLAPGNLTLGYGKVIKVNETYYDNITKSEGFAYLLDTINNEGYAEYVNDFLIDNNINFNQHQFDALVCFTYNLGNGWMYDSDLADVILNQSIVSITKEELKIGDTVIVNSSSGLNLRSGPGTSFEVIETLNNKTKLILLDTKLFNDEWYYVETPNGNKGYCNYKYIKTPLTSELKKLSNIPPESFINEILQWNMSSGVHIYGLLYRRIDEAEMFLYEDYIRDGAKNKYSFTLPVW